MDTTILFHLNYANQTDLYTRSTNTQHQTQYSMSSNLNYKQVAQVSRRKWDSETYEKCAQDRRTQSEEASSATGGNNTNNRSSINK
jgi:predicted transposase YbfD/YdcC